MERFPRLFLIIGSDLQTEVPAARMDDDIDAAVFALVGFNKVIAASEGTETAVCLADVHPRRAVKFA